MTDPARPRPSFTRLLVAGTIGGLAASAAMTGAQRLLVRAEDRDGESDGEPSSQNLADAVSEGVTGEAVAERNKAAAGKAVHYATGAALGALYGVGSRWLPATRAGWGTGYGVAVSAVLDEGLVPALGLSDGPTQATVADHVEGGVGHLVFGLALETVTRIIAGAPHD